MQPAATHATGVAPLARRQLRQKQLLLERGLPVMR